MSAPEPIRSALITRAPVRSATAVQNAGPSSPCSCTYVSPIASVALTTSSSVGLTNTPTTSSRRRSRRAMPVATAGSAARRDCGHSTNPIAQASSDAASSASSCRVMPQNLTRGMSPILVP